MESVCVLVLLGLCALSSPVLGIPTDGDATEGRFPILMPNVHPYRVSETARPSRGDEIWIAAGGSRHN